MTQDATDPQPYTQGKHILIASDHAGFELKEKILSYLETHYLEYTIHNITPELHETDDYPDIAQQTVTMFNTLLSQGVPEESVSIIALCGSGNGICIALNRCPRIRAVNAYATKQVVLGRQHLNMNALCLGGGIILEKRAIELVKLYMSTQFSQFPRHQRRIDMLNSPLNK